MSECNIPESACTSWYSLTSCVPCDKLTDSSCGPCADLNRYFDELNKNDPCIPSTTPAPEPGDGTTTASPTTITTKCLCDCDCRCEGPDGLSIDSTLKIAMNKIELMIKTIDSRVHTIKDLTDEGQGSTDDESHANIELEVAELSIVNAGGQLRKYLMYVFNLFKRFCDNDMNTQCCKGCWCPDEIFGKICEVMDKIFEHLHTLFGLIKLIVESKDEYIALLDPEYDRTTDNYPVNYGRYIRSVGQAMMNMLLEINGFFGKPIPVPDNPSSLDDQPSTPDDGQGQVQDREPFQYDPERKGYGKGLVNRGNRATSAQRVAARIFQPLDSISDSLSSGSRGSGSRGSGSQGSDSSSSDSNPGGGGGSTTVPTTTGPPIAPSANFGTIIEFLMSRDDDTDPNISGCKKELSDC